MFVLNVDDDSDDREVFHDAVHSIDPNIYCVQVESGIMALQLLNRLDKLPDYIFVDINMPKMGGIEFVKKIKSMARFMNIQIIMYSTAFDPKDETYLAKMGIRYWVKKSKFSDLVNSLKMLLTVPPVVVR